mgnify:FL=1
MKQNFRSLTFKLFLPALCLCLIPLIHRLTTPPSVSKVVLREDGGYSITIDNYTRSWFPITAEGSFPIIHASGTIEMIGTGYYNERWNGFLYDINHVKSHTQYWDIGYVFVDTKREWAYFNLHWVGGHSRTLASEFNGKYQLPRRPRGSIDFFTNKQTYNPS